MLNAAAPGSNDVEPLNTGVTLCASAVATWISSCRDCCVPGSYQPSLRAGLDDTPNTAIGSIVTGPEPALTMRGSATSSLGVASGLSSAVVSELESPTRTGIS